MLGFKRSAAAQWALKHAPKITAAFFLSVEKKKNWNIPQTTPQQETRGENNNGEKTPVWTHVCTVSLCWVSMWLETDRQINKSEPKRLKTAFFFSFFFPFNSTKVLMNVGPDALVYLSLVSLVVPPPGSLCSFSSWTSSPSWAEPETCWPNWWLSLLS